MYSTIITFRIILTISYVTGIIQQQHSSISHLLSAIGSERVAVHFQSDDLLHGALDHAWSQVNDTSLPLFACTELRNARAAQLDVKRRLNIEAKVVYSTGNEDLACLRYEMGYKDTSYFHSSSISFKSVFPHLHVFKYDISIPHVLGFIEKQQGTMEEYKFNHLKYYHPMVRDYVATRALEIQVIFIEGLGRHVFEPFAHAWIEDVQREDYLASRLNHFFFTAYEVPRSGYNSSLKQGLHSRAFQSKRSGNHEVLLSSYKDNTYYRPAEHWALWRRLWLSSPFRAQHLAATCRLSSIDVRHRSQASLLTYSLEMVPAEYRAACAALLLHRIVLDASVAQVGLSRPIRLQNKVTRAIVQGDGGQEPFLASGLDGAGVVVGQSDTGVDQYSCFFIDPALGPVKSSSIEAPLVDHAHRKVVQYIDYSGSRGDYAAGHGSHTAGTIVGNCIDASNSYDINYNGIAYGAKLAVFDIGKRGQDVDLAMPDDIRDIFRPALVAGAQLHSNSWGGGYFYDSYALEMDAYAYENDGFLAFFAGGNDGAARTVLSPGIAKNAVGVAGSNQNPSNAMAGYSSWGPTFDGRIKPDITLPGSGIKSVSSQAEGSTLKTCSLRSSSGTSMATPAAAGSAALILQYFQDSRFWPVYCNQTYALCGAGAFKPTAYLLKSLVLHSGVSMQTPGKRLPDEYQGYGRLDLSTVLPLKGAAFDLFVDYGELTEFSEISYQVRVLRSTAPLKVTVSWLDPPNRDFMAKVLLHDLDVVVRSPAGALLLGNCALDGDGTRHADCLRDELNNNEQVTVATPTPGLWTVLIQSKLLTETARQRFGVSITSAGYVTGKSALGHVSFEDVKSCPFTGVDQGPLYNFELDITMMEFLYMNGWSKDSYLISRQGVPSTQTGKLHGGYSFQNDKSCLQENGCYDIELKLTDSQETPMVEVSHCDVFLASLVNKSSFCLERNVANDGFVCTSQYKQHDYFSLSVSLYEEGCDGWSGSYFAIHDGSQGVAAGTLEWGCELHKQIYLPAYTPICYIFHLHVPHALVDYYPLLNFTDSYQNTANGRISCPYLFAMNITIGNICIDSTLLTGRIDFYASIDIRDYSDILIKWTDIYSQMERSKKVGSCLLDLTPVLVSDVKQSSRPTLAPLKTPMSFPTQLPSFTNTNSPVKSASPTVPPSLASAAPSTLAPSPAATTTPSTWGETQLSIIFDSRNLSCFSSCPYFPSKNDPTFFAELCSFFLKEIYTCGTFGVVRAICTLPICAQSCSREEWCYFGVSAVSYCGLSDWAPQSDLLVGLSNDCVVHATQNALTLVPSGDINDSKSSDSLDTSSSSTATSDPTDQTVYIVEVALGSILAFWAVAICIYCWVKIRRERAAGLYDAVPLSQEDYENADIEDYPLSQKQSRFKLSLIARSLRK